MILPAEVFKIGKMGRAHGLRGEIDMHFTDDIFDRVEADYLVCDIDGLLVPFFLEEWRFRGQDTAILKFENLDSADAVRILQSADVYFPKKLAEGNQDELYSWKSLTGFSVSDTKAGQLGTVVSVDDSSANILMVLQTPQGDELLLPVHPDLVSNLDTAQRTIELDLPEGLLALN